ncbi:DUF2236 domain-containing protein, partial [Amycolatopsis sp. PS_44_ISF1]|nr:DUF2236 domain-containing protein [Amycolatopsis sp. PS_44_ISF1]MDT8916355.1 DUF2236 domain-containing protein [Amycolatopsis sp. PS_44_ISF1]
MDDPVLFRQGGFRLAARRRGTGANGDEGQVRRLREFAQREDQAADRLVAWVREGR